MLTRENRDEHFARAHFQLYVANGLIQFGNWLTMKYDKLDRKEVVESLRYESVMEMAESRLRYLEGRIVELCELIHEAKQLTSDPTTERKEGE